MTSSSVINIKVDSIHLTAHSLQSDLDLYCPQKFLVINRIERFRDKFCHLRLPLFYFLQLLSNQQGAQKLLFDKELRSHSKICSTSPSFRCHMSKIFTAIVDDIIITLAQMINLFG